MSSSRPSISSSDENESAQNTSSTVQYSTVVHSGYRHQVPSVQVFSRSESTQPLLDSEERPEDLQLVDNVDGSDGILPRQRYFKQNCSQHETSPDISHFERSQQEIDSYDNGYIVIGIIVIVCGVFLLSFGTGLGLYKKKETLAVTQRSHFYLVFGCFIGSINGADNLNQDIDNGHNVDHIR